MSLVRAFTTRRNRAEVNINTNTSNMLGRAASQRVGKPSVIRAQISSPLALVSTSNALLNNATKIAGTRPIEHRTLSGSSAASISGDESDGSTSSMRSAASTLTDASSIESSMPSTPVEPNHLSCYFNPAVDTETKTHSRSSSVNPSSDAPNLPRRALSHSKRAHEGAHRQRSIRRMMSSEPTTCESTRTSFDISASTTPSIAEPKENPFGPELAQLDEVAEDYCHVVRDAEADADAKVVEAYGLAIFSAFEYMSEIQSLVFQAFADEESAAWI